MNDRTYKNPLGRAIADLSQIVNSERPSPFGVLNTYAADLRALRFSQRPFETRNLARELMAELVATRGIGQAMIFMQEAQDQLNQHSKGLKA
jgi:hypothetical protein